MPSHNHDIRGWTGDFNDGWAHNLTTSTVGLAGEFGGGAALTWLTNYIGSQGGNQPHNIMPRFMSLAYIMKL